MVENALEVRNLTVGYATAGGTRIVVEDLNLSVGRGEYFGLVGESGCGKTTVGKALLRLLPDSATCRGTVRLNGRDLLALPENEMRRARWKEISVITQSSMNALVPVARIGSQFREIFRLHSPGETRAGIDRRTAELLNLVGLAPEIMHSYPHQLSGGMKQRIVIAMAVAFNPELIVADEPTTALDVILQDQIFSKINEIHRRSGKSMLLITHDMGLVAENCRSAAVMYAGQIVETGTTEVLFGQPHHPYTMGLKNAFPSLEAKGQDAIAMPGAPPGRFDDMRGCRFAPRCPFSSRICAAAPPPVVEVGSNHWSRCHFPERAEEFRAQAARKAAWRSEPAPGHAP